MTDEWVNAAHAIGVGMPEHLEKYEKPRSGGVSHVLIGFNEDEDRWWASTSLMGDMLHGDRIATRFGLPPESVGESVNARYISLNPVPIGKHQFVTRYPDVPWKKAYPFVLAHEIGHVIRGWQESDADDFAFKRLRMKPKPAAKKMRETRYASFKHPMDFLNRQVEDQELFGKGRR